MQEKLIIFLHANNLIHPSWVVVAADTITQQAQQDNPENLAMLARDKEVLVIVPGENVLLTQASLPKMNLSRLIQAVPFLLEEQLIGDVETLHFAIGKYQPDAPLPIAVVSKEKMQEWTSLLKSWSLQANAIIPMMFALPCEENTWHILINEMAVVRTGAFQGFSCDKENLVELLELAFTASDHFPQLLKLHNEGKGAFAPKLNPLTTVQEAFIAPDKLISNLAKEVVKSTTINLLQDTYATRKSKFIQLSRVWKAITYLTAAWIILLFLYPLVSYLILHSQVNKIDKEIAQIYKRNFPQATSVIAPQLRMQEKLNKLNSQGGENQLFILLGDIAKGKLATTNIEFSRLDFQNGQITLELNAATSDDFSAFTDFLVQQGLKVKQQNANLVGSRINATLLIE